MGKLDGKIALVTGASKGISAGIALSRANEGTAVAVDYHSDRAGADRVVEKIKVSGGKAITVPGSVTPRRRSIASLTRQRSNSAMWTPLSTTPASSPICPCRT